VKQEELNQLMNDAESGNVVAQYNLGLFYQEDEEIFKGLPIIKNVEKSKAVKWYMIAAKNGHADAQYQLGKILDFSKMFSKIGGPVNDGYPLELCIDYYKQAANQGHVLAQYTLGVHYKNYLSVVAEYPGNAHEMDQESETFYDNAYYDKTIIDNWRDEACRWLLLAADNGNLDAQLELAIAYADGELFQQDYVEAARRFHIVETSVQSSDIQLQFKIGKAYKIGKGTPKDILEAVKWLKKAALNGHINSQIELANIYKIGKGIKKDLIEAYAYFDLASETKARDRVYKTLSVRKKREAIIRAKVLFELIKILKSN